MDDAWTPGKDGLKLLELRLGIEAVELRKNAALAGVSESASQRHAAVLQEEAWF